MHKLQVKQTIFFLVILAFVPLACQLLTEKQNNDDEDVRAVFKTMEGDNKHGPKDASAFKDSGATVKGMKQEIWSEYTIDTNAYGVLIKDEIGKYRDNKREGLWHTYITTSQTLSGGVKWYPPWDLYSACRYAGGLKDSFEITYHTNSDTASFCNYKNGKMYGECKTYFRNHQLQGIYRVRNGQPWLKKDYYENGSVKSICSDTLLNNVAHTFYRLYYVDSTLQQIRHSAVLKETVFLVNDTIWDGPLTEFFPDGKIKSVTTYVNGNADGEAKEFWDNGQLNMTWVYSKGLLLNIKDHFNKNGNKMDPGTLKNGNGTVKLYNDDNDSLKEILHYKNGLEVNDGEKRQ
jgi:antitoxin component YwqK of YwqJK toxin-antitoxin module